MSNIAFLSILLSFENNIDTSPLPAFVVRSMIPMRLKACRWFMMVANRTGHGRLACGKCMSTAWYLQNFQIQICNLSNYVSTFLPKMFMDFSWFSRWCHLWKLLWCCGVKRCMYDLKHSFYLIQSWWDPNQNLHNLHLTTSCGEPWQPWRPKSSAKSTTQLHEFIDRPKRPFGFQVEGK